MAKKILTFTSSQLWVVPNDCYKITELFLVGGGGGSAGGTIDTFGSAGAGGRVLIESNIDVIPASKIKITVGQGGLPGVLGGDGGAGGSTLFGEHHAVKGGSGGKTTPRSGGSTSVNHFGRITEYVGHSSGAAAGAGKSATEFESGWGYRYNNKVYGDGGLFALNELGDSVWGHPGTGNGGGISKVNADGSKGGSGVVIISYEPATFTIKATTSSTTAGNTVSFDVITTNVSDGAKVAYTVSGVDVEQSSGSFLVFSNDGGKTGTGSIILTVKSESITESNINISLTSGLAVSSMPVVSPNAAIPDIESKIISASDYNLIRNKVAKVLGTSSTADATYGWGQLVQSSEVNVSTKVGVSDWNKLRFDIINAWVHIYNATPSLVTAVQHSLVRGDTETSPYSQYDTYANTIVSNRFSVSSSQSQTLPAVMASTDWPGLYGNNWKTRVYAAASVSWPSSAEARHFFNSGGELRFSSSRTGGSTSGQIVTQNANWTDLLNRAGTQGFGGVKPGTGTSPMDGKNFYRLTNSFQPWFSESGTLAYSSNQYVISARTPSVANNSSGTANVVEFLIEWIDNHTPKGTSSVDYVDGTLSIEVSARKAIGTLLPSGTGNITITSPTITITQAPRP